MAIKSIKKLEITCDTCKKVIMTGRSTTEFVSIAETDAKYTELYCTDCVKLKEE